MNLKPCPFCGSIHLVKELKPSAWDSNELEYHIVCNDCACSGPVYIWSARANESMSAQTKRATKNQCLSNEKLVGEVKHAN